MRAAVVTCSLAFAVGCNFAPSVAFDPSSPTGDGGTIEEDATVPGPDATPEPVCAGHFLDTCATDKGTAGPAVVLDDGLFILDTDSASIVDDDEGSVVAAYPQNTRAGALFIYVDSLTIGTNATLRVVGSRGLLLASASTIEVSGTINASSTTEARGAGSDVDCDGLRGPAGGGTNDNGAGGAGGSFGGAGGDGGSTDIGGNKTLAQPPLVGFPAQIRGGCDGGRGGIDGNNSEDERVDGGFGGGAVVLNAATSITVNNGHISANGAGGRGGLDNPDGGGGGGGSGGLIALEAPTIQLVGAAIVAANGGGGGQGGRQSDGNDGNDGQVSNSRAPGGSGSDGPDGGAGSGQTAPGDIAGLAGGDGTQDNPDTGGGGGGGGAGIILIDVAGTITVTISPDPRFP